MQRLGRSAHADHLRGCAGAATRPKRSARSANASASRSESNVIDIALLEHAVREDLERARPARDGGAAAAEGRHRQLSGGSGRSTRRDQQSGGRRRRARARCRSRASIYIERDDFMENPPQEVLPLVAGQRSPPAVRVLHQVHGRGQGPRHRRSDRASLPPTIRRRAAEMPRTAVR